MGSASTSCSLTPLLTTCRAISGRSLTSLLTACNVPVIVTEDTGMKESVVEGQNGFIIPTGDSEALLERLRRLQVGPALPIRAAPTETDTAPSSDEAEPRETSPRDAAPRPERHRAAPRPSVPEGAS